MPEAVVLGSERPVFRPESPMVLVCVRTRYAILVPNAKIVINDRQIAHARKALEYGRGLFDGSEVIDQEHGSARMRELLCELYSLIDEKITEFPVHHP